MTIRDAKLHSGVAREATGSQRRRMTVSEALKWAWSDELPKVPSDAFYDPPLGARSAWSAIQEFGALNAMIDRQPNRYGCIPFDRAETPHRDALLIADAVSALAECCVDVPDGWHPMPELAAVDDGLGRAAVNAALHKATDLHDDGSMYFRTRPDILVVRHAIVGLAPDWRMGDLPVRRYVANDNGVEMWFVRREIRSAIGINPDGSDRVEVINTEVDGWSQRLRRPVAGAYRKPYLDPDPVPVMVARAEYEILVAALAMLCEELAGRLDAIELTPMTWPAQPWAADSAASGRAPRILPDLRAPRSPVDAAESKVISKGKARRGRPKKTA